MNTGIRLRGAIASHGYGLLRTYWHLQFRSFMQKSWVRLTNEWIYLVASFRSIQWPIKITTWISPMRPAASILHQLCFEMPMESNEKLWQRSEHRDWAELLNIYILIPSECRGADCSFNTWKTGIVCFQSLPKRRRTLRIRDDLRRSSGNNLTTSGK